jgi:hypothetical protein
MIEGKALEALKPKPIYPNKYPSKLPLRQLSIIP